jgi:F0F1-type ATP synthase alpha subunit
MMSLLQRTNEENMKVKDMIESKYLRKEDYEEDTVHTIKGVKLEDLGKDERKEERWILYFREASKGMVLNVTTIRVLEAAYGDDTDLWLGKKITIYVDPNVSFQGRVVGGLRLRPMKPEKTARPGADQSAVTPDMDDDIPF